MTRGTLAKLFGSAPLILALCLGCKRDAGRKAGTEAAPVELSRGDVVVVESAAAEFFQGRVLSVSGETLKVQSAEEGEPVVVSRSDAYRVAMPAASSISPGEAVCNDAPNKWHGCLVVKVDGGSSIVRLASGAVVRLERARVLSPTAVTALNVRRLFERLDASRQFADSARRAGEPESPRGWTPERREPVLARRGDDWFSAHVESLQSDGGVVVRWEGEEHPEAVTGSSVVPIPPFARTFAKGEFVLIAPPSKGERWRRVRIEAVGADEAIVVDDTAERIRISVRELVPLSPSSP